MFRNVLDRILSVLPVLQRRTEASQNNELRLVHLLYEKGEFCVLTTLVRTEYEVVMTWPGIDLLYMERPP